MRLLSGCATKVMRCQSASVHRQLFEISNNLPQTRSNPQECSQAQEASRHMVNRPPQTNEKPSPKGWGFLLDQLEEGF